MHTLCRPVVVSVVTEYSQSGQHHSAVVPAGGDVWRPGFQCQRCKCPPVHHAVCVGLQQQHTTLATGPDPCQQPGCLPAGVPQHWRGNAARVWSSGPAAQIGEKLEGSILAAAKWPTIVAVRPAVHFCTTVAAHQPVHFVSKSKAWPRRFSAAL